jgi:GNAT superfamily N-acetyltransferase
MSAAEQRSTPPLVFRPPTNAELHLVKASWLYATPSESKIAPNDRGERWMQVSCSKQLNEREAMKPCVDLTAAGWHRAHGALRDQILSSMATIVVIAALASKRDEAIGWVAVEKGNEGAEVVWTVWWTHVVGEARGQGVGSALLQTVLSLADSDGALVRAGQMSGKAREWWARNMEGPR